MGKCATCGEPFPDNLNGRPRVYCCDDCKDYNKFKTALENILMRMEPAQDEKKIIRGDMFRLANILSNGTKSSGSKND